FRLPAASFAHAEGLRAAALSGNWMPARPQGLVAKFGSVREMSDIDRHVPSPGHGSGRGPAPNVRFPTEIPALLHSPTPTTCRAVRPGGSARFLPPPNESGCPRESQREWTFPVCGTDSVPQASESARAAPSHTYRSLGAVDGSARVLLAAELPRPE